MATDYDKYPHYFKVVPEVMTHIDVYGVLRLFNVQSQEIGHAIKKLLVPGVRGSKSSTQDIQEAIDTLERWKILNKEFEPKAAEPAEPVDNFLRHSQVGRKYMQRTDNENVTLGPTRKIGETPCPSRVDEPAEPLDEDHDEDRPKLRQAGKPAYTNLCFEVPTYPGPKLKKPGPAPDDGYDD